MSDESVFPPAVPPALIPKRPAALMVFGVLNLVFGLFAVVSCLVSWKLYYAPLEGQTGMMPDLLRKDSFYAQCMRVLLVPGALMAVAQVVSGIGLIQASDGARRMALWTGVYGLLAAVLVGYLTIQHVLPFTMEEMLRQMAAASKEKMDPMVAEITRTTAKVGGVIGALGGLIYPTLLLIFLSRSKIREYCLSRAS